MYETQYGGPTCTSVGLEDAAETHTQRGTNTKANRLRVLIARGINGGEEVGDSSANTYSALRHRYLPASTASEMSEISVSNPIAYGEIYEATTVNQLTQTVSVSTGDDSTLLLNTSQGT